MKRAIKNHLRDFLMIAGIVVLATVVAGYISSNQRLRLPAWVPAVGTEFVDYKAEMESAKSLIPGQGQSVTIAGVTVGEIGDVTLRDGRAVVTLRMRKKYATVHRNATALARPKTGLEDMTIELAPGTPDAGRLPVGGTIPVSQTSPAVQFDEILSSLDKDSRDSLVLLVGGAGQALRNNERALAQSLRRFAPATRDIREITSLLEQRRLNIRRVAGNLRLVAESLGEKDRQLASLVRASNEVFGGFAAQDRALRSAIRQLPGTLEDTRGALKKLDTLATDLGPALTDLRPGARALEPSSKALQETFTKTRAPIEEQLRPFARDIQPTARSLRKASGDLSETAPALARSIQVINVLANGLAYNPGGSAEEGYLFWLTWLSHSTASIGSTQDANGPLRRTLTLGECATIYGLQNTFTPIPALDAIADLSNFPRAKNFGDEC